MTDLNGLHAGDEGRGLEASGGEDPESALAGQPRFQRAERQQMQWLALSLEELIPVDHRVRGVWDYASRMDLSALYESIKARTGSVGRSPIDPRILMALWLYATVEGVGSARALERLCEEHVAYRWICGGVGVNHHTLSDFRTGHAELLDRLLTQSVTALMACGLVSLNRVAQDGLRVRASAGSNSFHRRETLERLRAEAQEQVDCLKRELHEDPGGTRRREDAARERAAHERSARVNEALGQLPALEKKRKAAGSKGPARVSTTDPDARTMMMPGGGFRPAYNVQFNSDTASQVVVGVSVTNQGSDQGLAAPMADQIEQRYQRAPHEYLVDGGFVKNEDIEALAGQGTTVYAPVPPSKQPQRDPHEACASDGPGVAAWRQRMATDVAKEIYKERASTAECINAQARNRGLTQFLVRGLHKVSTIACWFALAHNMMRWMALGQAAQTG